MHIRHLKNNWRQKKKTPPILSVVCVYTHTHTHTHAQWDNISLIKGGNPATCDNMNESGGHYVKWNKPDRERQIPAW